MHFMKFSARSFFIILFLCILTSFFWEREEKIPTLRITIEMDEFKNIPFTEYGAFYQYLTEETGRSYEIDFQEDRDVIIRDLASGTIDLAYMQGFSFLKAKIEGGAVPLVMGNEEAKNTSFFYVENDSPLTDINELSGKKIGFVSKYSTGGHLMPRFFLDKMGLNPEETAAGVFYADDLFEAFEWLKKDMADIVVTDGEVLKRMEYKGYHTSRLHRPIGETTPYPSHIWVVPESMPDEEQDKLRQAFLKLDIKNNLYREILHSLEQTGFQEANLSHFEQLKDITKTTKVLQSKPEIFTIRMGVHPYLPADELKEKFAPLAHYLEEELKMPVKVEVAKNYEEFIENMGRDLYHIVLASPYAYNVASKRYSRKNILLGKFEKSGSTSQNGVIVTKEESKIFSLEDLKGKTFAFGDPGSTLSYLLPAHYFCQNNFPMSNFTDYKFLDNQRNIAMGVLNGEFDAGAVKEDVYKFYQDNGLRKLDITTEVQEDFFTASNALPASLQKEVEAAFEKLTKNKNLHGLLRIISKDITGLAYAGEFDYFDVFGIRKDLQECGTEIIGVNKKTND